MAIRNGRVEGIPFRQAQWAGGPIEPTIVILHDTASSLGTGNAAAYLRQNAAKVSVHFVVDRDGSVEQQVGTGNRANHAGQSEYHGRRWCNGFSIGIEIVNPGRMERAGPGRARAWYGTTFDCAEYGIEEDWTEEHGAGLWMPYTEEQIDAVLTLLETLFDGVPSLKDITTHWYVSPGRKVDTNPLFPLDHVRARVLGRDDPADIEAEDLSHPAEGGSFVIIDTPGDMLNMRRWPSFNPNVVGAIPHDTRVPVIRSGTFDGRYWHLVQYGGREGWIVAAYADPLTERLAS